MPDIPQTANFLWLGLGAVGVLVGGFLLSMALRFRDLQKDVQMIEQLREDD